MSSFTFMSHTFRPLETIRLGRFVHNWDAPQSNYHDPDYGTQPLQPLVASQLNYGAVQVNAAERDFSAFLTSILSFSWAKRRRRYIQVTTDRATTYQLDNSEARFREALRSPTTCEWMKQALGRRGDIYMVVGYNTMQDAVVVEGIDELGEAEVQLRVPVMEAGVVPPGNMGDPGIEGHRAHLRGRETQYVASGEQICAVQYRKVCFRWGINPQVEDAFLDRNSHWRMSDRIRAKIGGLDMGTNDIMEAVLEDVVVLDAEHELYESGSYGKFVI